MDRSQHLDKLKESMQILMVCLATACRHGRQCVHELRPVLLEEGLLDVYDLDIVYARRFMSQATNIFEIQAMKNLWQWLDKSLLKAYSSSDGKKLIAFPWNKDQGILYIGRTC